MSEQTNLEWVSRCVGGHVANATERWRNQLHFAEAGELRLVATLGWIDSLRWRDAALAGEVADGLVYYLDYLANYGGVEARAEDGGFTFPCYRVVLGDDAGLGSFTTTWYKRAMDPAAESWSALTLKRWSADRYYEARYVRSRNGVLIYRGPSADRPEWAPGTVEVHNYWSSHT